MGRRLKGNRFLINIELPRSFISFMRLRIEPLLQTSEIRRPLIDLLANAYFVGLRDAMEVLHEQGMVAVKTEICVKEEPKVFFFGMTDFLETKE